MAAPANTSKRRQLGEESRRKILDAVALIAGERGYDGTSMAAVSEASGLPVASIYWHFTNKDQLIAAAIERSFERWLASTDWRVRPGDHPVAQVAEMLLRNGEAFLTHHDFLRLGLMLTLERRPDEPAARRRFLEVREATLAAMSAGFRDLWPALTAEQGGRMARLTMLAGDGMFVAAQAEPDVSLAAIVDDLAVGLTAIAERMTGSG